MSVAIAHNITWLYADKILRMGGNLLVVFWLARYLGAEQFGLWNFAIAFTALFSAFASLGLDTVVVRELVRHPQRKNEILGSALVLKLVGGACAVAFTLIISTFLKSTKPDLIWLIGLIASCNIFYAVNVIDFYFQARVESKYTVYATNSAFALFILVKIFLIINGAPLIAFAWAMLAEVALTSSFLIFVYHLNKESLFRWRYKKSIALQLLRDSWPLILSGLAIMVYMRIDQIMIGEILGEREVGLYSAAVKVSEAWYFVPMAIIASMFPSIIEAKKESEAAYYECLQNLFNLMVIIGISVAIPLSFIGSQIIEAVYGADYQDAAGILAIHIWTGIFVFLGSASSRWFLVENLQKYSFYRTVAGAVLNILLNFILIPKFGISGAAWATLASQALASVFFNMSNKKLRVIFHMQLKSLLFIDLINRKR